MNDTPTAASMYEVVREAARDLLFRELEARALLQSHMVRREATSGSSRGIEDAAVRVLAHVAYAARPHPGEVVGEQGNHDCLAKRAPDEPYLVLLARDPDAPTMADTWADRRAAAGGDPSHCAQVRAIAQAMRDWRSGPTGFPSKSAPKPSAYDRPAAGDGYATAFYEIAKMLGFGARAKSPFEVWRAEMKPKLEALTARAHDTGTVDRHALAKVLNEAAGPRRIAGEEEAALFADSKSEVQEYWLEMADAVIAAMPVAPVERFRHVKRGTLYEMVGTAELQAGQPQHEHAELAIYRGEDGKLWARNTAEFHDGRFVAVSSDQPAQPSRGFSRFDPPGLWESEPRSSADDAGKVQQ
ncbi:hypothetical protein [Sphingomonas sp. TREG-RG-20F-R18-01]|uniref:hypothetical protein n=1 Tax=Sphingomonas sp. TREG-RG-20F-R18-01 TaxID=2914982 RepID=UPI001F5A8B3D|nr:hypothetical protein [Sphingomonas sp. TREG-RG-20F-R18-01]